MEQTNSKAVAIVPSKANNYAPVPASIQAITMYGVPLSYLRCAILNVWNLHKSPTLLSSLLADTTPDDIVSMKLHKRNVSEVLKASATGIIKHLDVEYVVVYHGCTRQSLSKHIKCLLSFRQPAPEYQLGNYVLVKPYLTDEDSNTIAEEN